MPDRESVITHLQIIHTWAEFARERDLQFFTTIHLKDIAEWTNDAIAMLEEQDDMGRELTDAMELVRKKNERIEKLLKEQEAVEPYQHDAVWLCGNCEKEVVGWDDDIDGKEYRYPFCRQCGQAVKWE